MNFLGKVFFDFLNKKFPPAKDELGDWMKSASFQELQDGYEERRQQWIKDGTPHGEVTPDMKRINKEISRRREIEWENDPKRSKDPNFRWTDEARWDDD